MTQCSSGGIADSKATWALSNIVDHIKLVKTGEVKRIRTAKRVG